MRCRSQIFARSMCYFSGDLRSSLEALGSILASHRSLEPLFNSNVCPKCASHWKKSEEFAIFWPNLEPFFFRRHMLTPILEPLISTLTSSTSLEPFVIFFCVSKSLGVTRTFQIATLLRVCYGYGLAPHFRTKPSSCGFCYLFRSHSAKEMVNWSFYGGGGSI